MLFTSLIIASSFVVGAAITDGLEPALLTLVRFLLSMAFFAPWIGVRFGWRRIFCCPWPLFLRCGAISFCLVAFFVGMFYALRFTSALNTSVIYTLVPAMSALLSFLLVKERFSRQVIFALFLGLVGAVWVIFEGRLSLLWTLSWGYGDMVFAVACVVMAFYTPLLKFLYRGEEMEEITYWILVSGSVWLLLYVGGRSVYTNGLSALLQVSPMAMIAFCAAIPFSLWAGIVYLVLFSTILSFYLTQIAIPHLGPTRVIAFSYSYPALVLVIEFFLGHGLPSPQVLPGVAIICFSMMVMLVRNQETGIRKQESGNRNRETGIGKLELEDR